MQHVWRGQTRFQARAMTGPLQKICVSPSLDELESLVLWGVRQWMRAHEERRCATRVVLERFEVLGLVPALAPLNRIMTMLVFGSICQPSIATVAAAPMSIDERVLLRMLTAARHRQTDLVESYLGIWMEKICIKATAEAALLLAQLVFASRTETVSAAYRTCVPYIPSPKGKGHPARPAGCPEPHSFDLLRCLQSIALAFDCRSR